MPSVHSEMVQKEVDRLLSARVITPVESSWTSPLVISTKKDGSPRFVQITENRVLEWLLTVGYCRRLIRYWMIGAQALSSRQPTCSNGSGKLK